MWSANAPTTPTKSSTSSPPTWTPDKLSEKEAFDLLASLNEACSRSAQDGSYSAACRAAQKEFSAESQAWKTAIAKLSAPSSSKDGVTSILASIPRVRIIPNQGFQAINIVTWRIITGAEWPTTTKDNLRAFFPSSLRIRNVPDPVYHARTGFFYARNGGCARPAMTNAFTAPFFPEDLRLSVWMKRRCNGKLSELDLDELKGVKVYFAGHAPRRAMKIHEVSKEHINCKVFRSKDGRSVKVLDYLNKSKQTPEIYSNVKVLT